MSMEAELVQALGRIEAKAEMTSKKVADGGSRMEQSLRRTANQAGATADKFSQAQRSIMGLAKGFAAGLGFGSVDMIGGTALRYIQQMRQEAERERQERIEGASGFLSGTRAPEIMASVPAIRQALVGATPAVADDQRVSILQAILSSGADRSPESIARIAAQSAAGPAMGMTRQELAGLIGTASRHGVGNAADLAAFALNRSGGNVSEARSALASMNPRRAQYVAGQQAGAFDRMIGSAALTDADREQLRSQMIAGAKKQINQAQAMSDLAAQNQREERALSPEQRLELATAEGGGFERFTVPQMFDLLAEYQQSMGRGRRLPYGFTGIAGQAMMNQALTGDLAGFETFPEFLQGRIQRVEVVPTTQPIGDDQP